MSLKEQTLTLLAEVPDESPAWQDLRDDAQLLHALAVAETDVRNGRLHSIADVEKHFDDKWERRRSISK